MTTSLPVSSALPRQHRPRHRASRRRFPPGASAATRRAVPVASRSVRSRSSCRSPSISHRGASKPWSRSRCSRLIRSKERSSPVTSAAMAGQGSPAAGVASHWGVATFVLALCWGHGLFAARAIGSVLRARALVGRSKPALGDGGADVTAGRPARSRRRRGRASPSTGSPAVAGILHSTVLFPGERRPRAARGASTRRARP